MATSLHNICFTCALKLQCSKNISIDRNNIEACQEAKGWGGGQSRRVNQMDIRLSSWGFTAGSIRWTCCARGNNLKGMNELLTQKIARKARFLKKKHKIMGTRTANFKVFIKLNKHSPEQAKVTLVRKLDELSKYEYFKDCKYSHPLTFTGV